MRVQRRRQAGAAEAPRGRTMSETMKQEMTANSFAETVVGTLSPLYWDEEAGRLAVDEVRLQENGRWYASLYVKVAVALLCLALLVVDLLVAVVPVTAVLFGVLSTSAAGVLLYGAARAWSFLRQQG